MFTSRGLTVKWKDCGKITVADLFKSQVESG